MTEKDIFICKYKDGTVVDKLSYEESNRRFHEAKQTDNPCSITLETKPYKAP